MNSDKPEANPFVILSTPAQRALSEHGVTSLKILATYREEELLQWHGIGPSSIPKLKQLLTEQGLTFHT
ncbi:hypothetical protein [Exiguobacterium artemiae]|uniref:hypothetical protein n=1 Tax=Exiguobacterium artemiae TaxID=340145 RepID=UPI0029648745|nr:hypothetical protein [Exiguobacterium sibiricum]MDW2885944.1 hypothetical protein [Exiguobacterium sibiricum]